MRGMALATVLTSDGRHGRPHLHCCRSLALAAPDIIEVPDFGTILADAVARFGTEMAASGLTFPSLDSDPATKLLQTFSYLV